jgi:hypothetical protein
MTMLVPGTDMVRQQAHKVIARYGNIAKVGPHVSRHKVNQQLAGSLVAWRRGSPISAGTGDSGDTRPDGS